MVEVTSTTVAAGVAAVDATRAPVVTLWFGCRFPQVRSRRLSSLQGVPTKRLEKSGEMDTHTC